MKSKKYTYKIGGSEMIIEKNDWMSFTESSLVASMGDTKVMVALALGGESDKDYLPLKVEYQERFYARGEILGSRFNKREGKPSTEATLSARVIDRSIRPYFPKEFTREINVVVTVLSLGSHDPDIIALNATALALEISTIPWDGPVNSVRVCHNSDGSQSINPTYAERDIAVAESVVAARARRLCMIELEGNEISEKNVENMISVGVSAISKLQEETRPFVKEYQQEKITLQSSEHNLISEIQEFIGGLKPAELLDRKVTDELKKQYISQKLQSHPDISKSYMHSEFEYVLKKMAREYVLANKQHLDGRTHDEVRAIYAQAGDISEKLHGTGLFYRGETHVLSVATLGKIDDALHINGMEINTEQNYIHHYNFPSYSVGEVGRMGSPGRREIGHGALAEKALRRVIPSTDIFPYTIRIVSEVLSSNGSTSMASACGSSIALMDAGVPLTSHVAGIAMGLVYTSDEEYVLLTDILGKEDHWGDMDFKVAGTNTGITAIQLDCKFRGLSSEMVAKTLTAAYEARLTILQSMNNEISKPRELTSHVEKVEVMSIPQDKIGRVIGSGGVTIKKITKESGAKIDIKRDGQTYITGASTSIEKARSAITALL